MKKTTIGVIGQGFVGNAIKEGFSPYYEMRTYDKYISEKSNSDMVSLVGDSDLIFVCVPTPMKETGECYTGIVEDVLEEINEICRVNNMTRICIIKSTIIPGTTKRMNDMFPNIDVIFSPEFLTEANAVNDFKNQKRIILGGLNKVTALVKPIFKRVFPEASIIKTDSMYAEMVKYVTNTFLATKVSFANEIYELCQKLDIDYDKVIEYAQYDNRLGKSHWAVPGPDGDYGFGGHCFPKDTQALMYMAFTMGVNPTMLAATLSKNDQVRNERDWEGMENRAVITSTTNFKEIESYATLEDMRNGIQTPVAGSAEPFVDPNQLELNFEENGIQ